MAIPPHNPAAPAARKTVPATHVHPRVGQRQVVLVMQGGGAMGAYQAGVYEALHEAGIEPDWLIGTSIGASGWIRVKISDRCSSTLLMPGGVVIGPAAIRAARSAAAGRGRRAHSPSGSPS